MQASEWLAGHGLGGFQYEGTRRDDPNDVVPHEDRRELRGKRVVDAWMDWFDDRRGNTFDSWIAARPGPDDASPGRVIHYQMDTSEALGSEWNWPQISRRLGYAYVVDWGDMARDLVMLGTRFETWDTIHKTPEERHLFVLLALAAISGLAGYENPGDRVRAWLGRGGDAGFVLVSGNIEAHQSVLGFKTVQSRIVELPFDEGQWVEGGHADRPGRRLRLSPAGGDHRGRAGHAAAPARCRRAERSSAAEQTRGQRRRRSRLQAARIRPRRCRCWSSGAGTAAAARSGRARPEAGDRGARARSGAAKLAAAAASSSPRPTSKAPKASLSMAQIVLGYTTLSAPFDGVILVRQAELGEIMVPGTPVVTLADLDHVWLRAYINETDIGKVRYGETADVTTDTYPGKTYKGRISFISSSAEFTPKSVETHAERVTLVYRIRIDIDNPTHELVPGMPADARSGSCARRVRS